MKGKDAVILIRVGADAAEMDDLFYAGLQDSLFVGAGPLRDLRHQVIVRVEEADGREQTIYGVGAGEGSGQKFAVFDVADGRVCSQGYNFFLFPGVAADDGYLMSFLDQLLSEWFANMA
jgi:hypothetical protein